MLLWMKKIEVLDFYFLKKEEFRLLDITLFEHVSNLHFLSYFFTNLDENVRFHAEGFK